MKSIFVFAALLTCTVASATSPCPPDATCDPNPFAVMFAASFVAMENACARIDPPRKAQYADALAKMREATFDPEDREIILNAMRSPLFNDRLKEAESRLESMESGELARECAALLRSE